MDGNGNLPGGTGYLTVQVTTARGGIPLAGAAVTIRRTTESSADVVFELVSGADGRTPRVALPTMPFADSQQPEDGKPYLLYSVEVRKQEYGAAEFRDVQIFDGVTIYQSVNLVPEPESGYPDTPQNGAPSVYESAPNDL